MVAPIDEFLERLKVFCDLNQHEMLFVGHWYQINWSKYSLPQKDEIKQRLSEQPLSIDKSEAIGYFLSSFFQNIYDAVNSMQRKEFLYQLFPEIDYFINRNSPYHDLALMHAFGFIMDNVINHTRKEGLHAQIVCDNLKYYIWWYNYPPFNQSQIHNLLDLFHSTDGKISQINPQLFHLHTAIQGLFMNNHPVIHLFPIQLMDFLDWWFKQTRFKFDYSDPEHTPWQFINDTDTHQYSLKSMIILNSRHIGDYTLNFPTPPPSRSHIYSRSNTPQPTKRPFRSTSFSTPSDTPPTDISPAIEDTLFPCNRLYVCHTKIFVHILCLIDLIASKVTLNGDL